MIYTYIFTDTETRNNFIVITKELGFKTSINTYTQNIGSKSIVNDHTLGSGRDVKTIHNSVTKYEVNIEKELTNEEKNNLEKLEKLFFYKKEAESFTLHLFTSMFTSGFITFIIFTIIVNISEKTGNLLINTGLIYLIGIFLWLQFLSMFSKSYKKQKNEEKKKINDLKNHLIKNYLGEKGIEIVKNNY